MRLSTIKPLIFICTSTITISCGSHERDENREETQAESWSKIYAELELNSGDAELPTTFEDKDIQGIEGEETPSELSDEVKERLKNLRLVKANLRQQRHDICGINTTLHSDIREQIKSIREDESLSHSEKISSSREIIAANKEAIDAQRELFQQCKVEHEEDLTTVRETEKQIREVCFNGHKPFSKKMRNKKKKGSKIHRSLTPGHERRGERKNKRKAARKEIKASIETSLNSEECQQLITELLPQEE